MKKAIILFNAFFVLLLSFPLIITFGAIASPFATIGSIFESIGDSFDKNNDVVRMLEDWFKSPEAYEVIATDYLPFILQDEVSIPVSWLIIPNIISGTDKPSHQHMSDLIKSAKDSYIESVDQFDQFGNYVDTINVIKYKLTEIDVYVSRIKSKFDDFDNVSDHVIVEYLKHFEYLNVYSPPGIIPEGDFIYPFFERANVSAEFGWYKPFGELMWHNGIDLAYPAPRQCGMPIYSVSDGVVVGVQNTDGKNKANHVEINSNGILIRYTHMRDTYNLPVGHIVNKGDYVGAIGATGLTTGCHLHLVFTVNGKEVNPRLYIDFE